MASWARQGTRATSEERATAQRVSVMGANNTPRCRKSPDAERHEANPFTETRQMQYALLVYNNENNWDAISYRGEAENAGGVREAFNEALKNAGAFTFAQGLASSTTATTVRVARGKPQVLNGPYADSKEQLGGIYVLDVPDLDAAIAWAARCPSAAWGVVEVRPVWGQ